MGKKSPTFALVSNNHNFHIYCPNNPSIFPQAYVKFSQFQFGEGFCIWAFDFGGNPSFLDFYEGRDLNEVHRKTEEIARKYITQLSEEYACDCYLDRTRSKEGDIVKIVGTK